MGSKYISWKYSPISIRFGSIFDLSKALDTTWRDKILLTLQNWKFKVRMTTFIGNFLSNWSFTVHIGSNTSKARVHHNGVPQGSVLSTILLNITINDISQLITKLIDTICFICGWPNFISEENLIQLHHRALDNRFKFSRTKSTAICFCQLRSCNKKLNLHIVHSTKPNFQWNSLSRFNFW